jgi:hypothetical protein
LKNGFLGFLKRTMKLSPIWIRIALGWVVSDLRGGEEEEEGLIDLGQWFLLQGTH